MMMLGLPITLTLLSYASASATVTTPENPIICQAAQNFDQDNYIFSYGDRLLVRPEFNYYWTASEEDKKYLGELQKMLKKYNINIITLPIPYQAQLYINSNNNPAPSKYNPEKANNLYESQVKNLSMYGFHPIDLLSVSKKLPPGIEFFAKRDHHWTGPTMEIVAEELKNTVKSLKIDVGGSAQTSISKRMGNYGGSIAEELSKTCGFNFRKSEERVFYDLSIKSNEGLLGEADKSIVMVGDSFSIPYFGFDKIVSDKLKSPVVNFSVNGGGCCSSINNYFSNLTPSDPKPALIIWTALMVYIDSHEARELKPSIYQAFEKSQAISQVKYNASSLNGGNLKIQLNPSARYFIQMNFKGPKIENLNFSINYGNDSEDVALYRRDESEKTSYTNSFFYELKPNTKSLDDIKISTKYSGGVVINLYKYN